MPFHVYVLHTIRSNKSYVGFTADLQQRLKSHNGLATKGWTIKFRPWGLVHVEVFQTKAEALKREKELKSARQKVYSRTYPSSVARWNL
jgi:putative endonuclease